MPKDNFPFPPGARVAAYLRDSGGDDQDLSVAQQERAVWEWCEDRQLILKHVFKDIGAPGSSVIGREGFHQMMDYFRGRNVPEKGLVIWSFARFSRSIDDAQFYLADLRRRGCQIHSMTDTIPEGTVGKLIEAVYIWKNQDFLETLSKEVKRGQHDLMKDRGALGGTPPRGFIREPLELGKRRDGSPHIVHRWVPDPAMLDTIRLAFEMKAAGATIRQIHETTHLYKSISCYDTFFSNRLYIGEMVFGETVILDYVEPIIDALTWNAVQERKRASTKRVNSRMQHPRRVNSRWLLSGLAYCGLCDAPLNSSSVPSRTGQAHDYYACSREQRGAGCTAKKIPKLLLEKTVMDYLREHVSSPEVTAEIRAMMRREAQENAAGIEDQIRQVNHRLGSARHRITNILNAIEQAQGSEALLSRLAALESEERDLVRQAKSLEIRRQSARETNEGDLLRRINRLLDDVNEMPVEDIKPLIGGFISKVTVARVEKTIQGTVLFYEVPKFELVNDEFL